MTTPDLARWLAEVAAEQRPVDADDLVRRTLVLVADADHVSVTVRTGREYTSLAASSEKAARCDARQYELGEGPCLEAALEGDWFHSADVGADPRWPRWGPDAAGHGVHSLLSVRLVDGERPFGALNIYADEPQRFTDRDQVDQALIWAGHAAHVLASARTIDHLQTALASRHTIGVAQGLLMERYGLDEDGAFMLLRRISSHRNEKLRDVATTLVRTRELPDTPD